MHNFEEAYYFTQKKLFTPGPLSTSFQTKLASIESVYCYSDEFKESLKSIKKKLFGISKANEEKYEIVFMDGSGTFGLESVIVSLIPLGKKILVLQNGSYGRRIKDIAQCRNIEVVELNFYEYQTPTSDLVRDALEKDSDIAMVSLVHCETSSGILNPLNEIGKIAKEFNKIFFVNAITTFGGVPIDFEQTEIDILVTAPNKCLESIPGFSITFVKKDLLETTERNAKSYSLDLVAQWEEQKVNGTFRFTPNVNAVLAFDHALDELMYEGGIEARAKRYLTNCNTLIEGMRRMHFGEYLFPTVRSYIITTFFYPENKNFHPDIFYSLLRDKNQIIYPGKLKEWSGFRISCIGRIFPQDIRILLSAIKETLKEMNVESEE